MSSRKEAQLFQKFSNAATNPDLAVLSHGSSSMKMILLPLGKDSKCFESSDLQQMVKYFAMMAESLGFKTETDKFGLPDINGFNPTPIRVKWAWNNFIKDLQDNDLMDESALRAIELNPKTKEDYERQLAEDAQKQLDEGIDKLSEKFKVTKQK